MVKIQMKHGIKYCIMTNEINKSRQHLKRCSDIVKTWPDWKKKALTPLIDYKESDGKRKETTPRT